MKWSFIILTTGCLLTTSLLVSAQPLPTGPRLRELADEIGLLIGVRAFLRNDAQKTIVEREFNTSTRTCYPREINRSPGQNDLENFNIGVNWLYERGMKPIHHMLFGPSQYESEWIREITSPAVLDSLMRARIKVIMESNDNASKLYVWNVVNEAFHWGAGKEGTYFEEDNTVWARMGYEDDRSGLTGEDRINDRHPVFIRKAFEYASQYAKGKLELRETGCESPCKKAQALYQLVRHLLNSGVRIDGVGLQCHFTLGKKTLDSQGLATEIRKYRNIGLEVYLDEIDFGRGHMPWTPETAELQKQEYKKLMTVALEEGVSQVHFWGLRDADERWRGDENPLLFNENLAPKPAYYGVQEALSEFVKEQ
jgi:GH35 family endo-1,4-beta-xylanase